MSKRDNSSLILQNLKKRELRPLGETVLPMEQAEKLLTGGPAEPPSFGGDTATAISTDSYHASTPDNMHAAPPAVPGTRLKPRRRAARSALIVRLDPALHRRLEEVARYNSLTMNDIATEAIELHLKNFPHPGDSRNP